MAVDLPPSAYADATRIRAFHTQLLERLARIPGADAVGAVSFRPMAGMGIMGNFSAAGPTPLPHGDSVDKPTVSPGYFRALGIRIPAGRDFTPADRGGAPGVVVVSQSVARRLWPGQDAVGKRISMQDDPGPTDRLTVIGVVNDVVQDEQLTRHSTIYLPYLQMTSPGFINHMTYVIRPAPGAANVAPAMRAALRDVDRAVPAQALQTMDQSMQIGRAHVCSSHSQISYAVFCLKKKKKIKTPCSLSELDNISKRLDDIQQCETESEA